MCALQLLVNVLGPDSAQVYPLLLPVLQHALDAQASKQPELLEDGLQLWLVSGCGVHTGGGLVVAAATDCCPGAHSDPHRASSSVALRCSQRAAHPAGSRLQPSHSIPGLPCARRCR